MEYKDIKHILLFDSHDCIKQNAILTNKTDELENLLVGSPIIYVNSKNQEIVIGVITYASNRPGSSLYYGDICLWGMYNEVKHLENIHVSDVNLNVNIHGENKNLITIHSVSIYINL